MKLPVFCWLVGCVSGCHTAGSDWMSQPLPGAADPWAGESAPDSWRVEVPGGVVGVRVADGRVHLSGPARLVYDGEYAF